MKFLRLYFLITIILSSFVYAQKSSTKLPLYLHGNSILSSKDIYQALGFKEKSIFEFYKSDEKLIERDEIDNLHSTIKAFYRTQGFWDSSIRVKTNEHNVTVSIRENSFIKIKDVSVESDFDLSELAIFKKGERFNPTKFSQIKMDIQKALLAKGYCSYAFDNKAFVDLAKHQAKLQYIIKKNKICRFGKVRVSGLTSIDQPIVTSRINIREAEQFNTQNIAQIYQALQKLEAFDSIVVNYQDKNGSIVPIDIRLQEREKKLIYRLGVGYDTNLGLRTTAAVERFNFLSNAKKLSLWLELSPQLQEIKSTLFMPSLNTLGFYFDYSATVGYKIEKFYDDFDTNMLYGGVELQKMIYDLSYNMGVGYEYTNYTGKSGEALHLNEDNLFLLYPYLKVIYDKRDFKLNPKNGYYLSALLEYGLAYNEHARSYTKMIIEGRYIKSIDDLTLSSVLKFGSINELQNITPETKRFFAGGSFSNRAYGYNEIGVITSPTTDSALGGLSMANLSLEANYPIYNELSGAIFSDISMISDKENKFDGEQIQTVGAGVRYNTPIGPVKIDAGVNVDDSEEYGITFQLGQSF